MIFFINCYKIRTFFNKISLFYIFGISLKALFKTNLKKLSNILNNIWDFIKEKFNISKKKINHKIVCSEYFCLIL